MYFYLSERSTTSIKFIIWGKQTGKENVFFYESWELFLLDTHNPEHLISIFTVGTLYLWINA